MRNDARSAIGLGLFAAATLLACNTPPAVPEGLAPTGATALPTLEPPIVEDIDAIGLDALAVANIQEAVAELRAEPDAWIRWLRLGMLYHANEILPEARISYERAVALSPEQPKPYYYLGLLHGQLGELDEALDAMHKAVEQAEGLPIVHWRLGFLLLESGDPDGAAEAFERALSIDPNSEAALLGAGRAAEQLGQPGEALRHLEQALAVGEAINRGHTHRLLAGVYQRLGREEAAERSLALAEASNPIYDDPWASELVALRTSISSRRDRALRLLEGGREAEALTMLQALVQEAPDDPLALEALGVVYARLGQVDRAEPIFERLTVEHPDLVSGPENLARALLIRAQAQGQAGDEQGAENLLSRGIEQIDRAIDLAPERATALGLRGDLLREAGRYDEAAAAYRAAAELDRRDPRWLAAAGRMELRLERWDRAAEALEMVTDHSPQDAQAWLDLALARLRSDRLDEAEQALDEAEALSGASPRLESMRDELASQRTQSSP